MATLSPQSLPNPPRHWISTMMCYGAVAVRSCGVLSPACHTKSTQAPSEDQSPYQFYRKSPQPLRPHFLPPTPPESLALYLGADNVGLRREYSDVSEGSPSQTADSCSTGIAGQTNTDTSQSPSVTCSPFARNSANCRSHQAGSDRTGALARQQTAHHPQLPNEQRSENITVLASIIRPEHHLPSESGAHQEEADGITFDDPAWEQSQSFNDFQEDPAHDFWKWNQDEQQWFHQDDDTGSVIWCPTELD